MDKYTAYRGMPRAANKIGSGEFETFSHAASALCGEKGDVNIDHERSSESRKFVQFGVPISESARSMSVVYTIDRD